MSQELKFEDHPALRNFNRTAFMARHVAKGILKWGVIGAAVGAAVAIGAGLAALMGVGGGISLLGALASYVFPSVATFFAGFSATAIGIFAAAGAGIGAITGGVVALTSAPEVADAKQDSLVAKYGMMENRQARMSALRQREADQYAQMVKQEDDLRRPNLQIPQGKQPPSSGLLQA